MAPNSIAYTEMVVHSFLKYQPMAHPFLDVRLHEPMRRRLNLDELQRTPLLRGPYIRLSPSFNQGTDLADLVCDEGRAV